MSIHRIASLILLIFSVTECEAFVSTKPPLSRSLSPESIQSLHIRVKGLREEHSSLPRCRRRNALRMGEFMDEERQRKLREMLDRQFGTKEKPVDPDEWCIPAPGGVISPGITLVANPEPFLSGDRATMAKFGLPESLPDGMPPDRLADLMPCILLLQTGPRGNAGVMLNRRTGMLMGDLGNEMGAFMIQPIFLGGTAGTGSLSYVHTYQEVDGCMTLTNDGLYFGGDLESAKKWVSAGTGSSFNFRFFLQVTQWGPGELEREIREGKWFPIQASARSILRIRDRKGPDTAKPMWTDFLHRAGDKDPSSGLRAIADTLYEQ